MTMLAPFDLQDRGGEDHHLFVFGIGVPLFLGEALITRHDVVEGDKLAVIKAGDLLGRLLKGGSAVIDRTGEMHIPVMTERSPRLCAPRLLHG